MKRWIIPILGAFAAHLLLFSLDPEWTRPVWRPPQNRTMTLALVDVPPSPAVAAPKTSSPAAPPEVSAPKKRLQPKTAPAPVKAPSPLPPEPTPAPVASMQTTAGEKAFSAVEPAAPPAPLEPAAPPKEASDAGGAAEAHVQASVPLYDLNPPPVYPAAARRRNLQGTVLLEVLVDREGRAAQVRVLRGSGHEMLDRSALNSVRQWRFAPARRDGRPQEMWVQVPVRFQLQ